MGNFLAILCGAFGIWMVFLVFGEPSSLPRARMVALVENPAVDRRANAQPGLPDHMQVGSIDRRPRR